MEIEDGPMMPEMPQMPHFSAEDMERLMTKFMQFIIGVMWIAIGIGFGRFLLHHPTTEQWIATAIVAVFCLVGYLYERSISPPIAEKIDFPELEAAA